MPMKLYHYDHCPYCVKVRMIFGFKQVPVQLEALANDDEATPISLIGQKMVPILIREDGEAMGESLDIVRYVDGLQRYGAPMIGPSRRDEELNLWLSELRNFHYALAMPRWIKMDLPEFETSSSVEYFVKKKTAFLGDFDQALAKSPELIESVRDHLSQLQRLMGGTDWFWGEPTLDDIHLFASLRVLTTVKGLEFPAKVQAYSQRLSEKSRVPLHWEKAL